PVNARLRGHALDRSRVLPLVTRGEPRILRGREVKIASDLFLGVIVDCSGSMSGANLERARRFAVLVAEAARGLPGVDARFFGFTDSVIYDAGDARRCAASSLEASGGNNDAAALDHVARVAAGSLRRAKLLVMVSDGMPTECSVAALRGVVGELTRRHRMLCAQVAVRPLEEVCFPNYVLLDEANLDAAVRRFAELIGRLVGRALTT
ncbi:MAG: VWA domain-containing protein, partial [Deltaproteobacteria bacterium]|nr:VWA domain-containing protein [Nannocystaceae bacterium]